MTPISDGKKGYGFIEYYAEDVKSRIQKNI
jgi:hypothetical protein